jgi:nucleotide-binding universal stress UspA family protein
MTPPAIRTLLVATDFSPHSERAQEWAVGLARQLGARIHLVHAYDLPLPGLHPYEVTVPDAYIAECHRTAARRLAEALERVRSQGVEADSRLSEVPAASAICDEARRAHCDLIVMGTRGNRGVKRLLLGSVAEHTLRMAPCPVVAVTAGE